MVVPLPGQARFNAFLSVAHGKLAGQCPSQMVRLGISPCRHTCISGEPCHKMTAQAIRYQIANFPMNLFARKRIASKPVPKSHHQLACHCFGVLWSPTKRMTLLPFLFTKISSQYMLDNALAKDVGLLVRTNHMLLQEPFMDTRHASFQVHHVGSIKNFPPCWCFLPNC